MNITDAVAIYRNTNRADFSNKLNRRFEEMADTLDEISKKNLTPEQKEDIELILNANVRKNYKDKKNAKKALRSISMLLVKHFQFVSKNHYKTVYITLCTVFSITCGTLLISNYPHLFIPVVCLGFMIGLFLGNKYDKLAASENRVIECW